MHVLKIGVSDESEVSFPICMSLRYFLKRSLADEVRNVSALVAIRVSTNSHRETLGIFEGAKEDKAGWSKFLLYLKENGLKDANLIISHACIGLIE